jgi:hypothetical protein
MAAENCIDCEQPLAGLYEKWAEITGWERAHRQQGGTNYVAGRKRTGRFVCGRCMVRRKAGISPQQGELI